MSSFAYVCLCAASWKAKRAVGKGPVFAKKTFRIQVSPMDCTGCEVCAQACPDEALKMTPLVNVRLSLFFSLICFFFWLTPLACSGA